MYFHGFFFVEYGEAFSVAQLTVDFFFVLSGFFLISSMQKLKKDKPLLGAWELSFSRLKPISFALFFATAFNAVCIILFIRDDILGVLFTNFCYWWYILYLMVGIAVFYLLFRAIKSKKTYAIFLVGIILSMSVFHYAMEEKGFFIYEFTYLARTFSCLAVGMLCSYLPKWKPKKFNFNAIFVAILFPLMLYLAHGQKTYFIRVLMVGLFAGLVYFSANVNVGGKIFIILGKLSARMYVYMSFVSMLAVLGVTYCKLLFIIDLFVSILDLLFSSYYKKYKQLKNKLA